MNEDGLRWFRHLVNIEVVDDGVETGVEVIQQSHHLHSQSDRTSSSDTAEHDIQADLGSDKEAAECKTDGYELRHGVSPPAACSPLRWR